MTHFLYFLAGVAATVVAVVAYLVHSWRSAVRGLTPRRRAAFQRMRLNLDESIRLAKEFADLSKELVRAEFEATTISLSFLYTDEESEGA